MKMIDNTIPKFLLTGVINTLVLRFALTVAACWLIAYGIAKPLTLRLLAGAGEKLQTNAAMVVGMGLYTVLNFLGQRFFAFKSSKSEDTDDHVAD